MFLATKSQDGFKVKLMRMFNNETEAMEYLKTICVSKFNGELCNGRIYELFSDKEPKLVYPARDKK